MGTTKINTIGCIVDAIYRVTKVEYPGGWEEHFTYWEPGMVKSKKNKKGMTETTVNYEYDDLYRLKKKDFPSGTDEEFEYFENSVLKKMKDASGEQQFTLDDASRLTKLVQGPIGFVENTNHYYKVENA